MSSRRKAKKYYLALPYSKNKFSAVRKRLGLKTAQKLSKSSKLFFQPIENSSRAAQFEYPEVWTARFLPKARKVRKQAHLPSFVQIPSKLTKSIYQKSSRDKSPLFQAREDYEGKVKVRRFRSKAYQHQSNARLVNKQLRNFVLNAERLTKKINSISSDFKTNYFSNLSELLSHVPVIKELTNLRLELVNVNISIATKKMRYYSHFPAAQNKNIIEKLGNTIVELHRLKDRFSRQETALGEVVGDLKLLNKQLSLRFKLGSDIVKMRQKIGEIPSNPSHEQVAQILRLKKLEEDFHTARLNQFEVEMKIYRLYGILLEGSSEKLIKSYIIGAKEKIREAIEMRRRLMENEE